MDKKRRFHTVLYLAFLFWWLFCSLADGAKNRCDKKTLVMTKSECRSCILSPKVDCPEGYKKISTGSGNPDCRYLYSVNNYSLSLPGCSHICIKEVMEPQCCPGYWGTDCMECPERAEAPCSNRGVCSDGLSGNGTCSCSAGFGGTACETCVDNNMYGANCSLACTCLHGLCNSGTKGDGTCTCFSGYKGRYCDQLLSRDLCMIFHSDIFSPGSKTDWSCSLVDPCTIGIVLKQIIRKCDLDRSSCSLAIPECAALRCSENARCIEDAGTGKQLCRCLPGHQGDGTHCTPINPCLEKICHSNAICTYLGPNRHSCTCAEGYQGDGQVCMAVDPCQDSFGNCPADSTVCVYDSPGKSHCQCKEGFKHLEPRVGCSLVDICLSNNTCSKDASCMTAHPGEIVCTCNEGYVGDGKTCYGNILQRLRELNAEPGGKWTGQLSSAITLFDSSLSWPLTSLGPFTIFIPTNKGFRGTSLKTLVSDQLNARYLSKLHMVATELSYETLKRGDIYYTLTGKSGESVMNEEDQQVKIRIHGSKKKASILQGDVVASNGVIHIINKLMDSVEPTVESDREENLLTIVANNGKFNKFRSLLQKSAIAHLLEGPGPITVFAPTNSALESMKEGTLEYLLSPEGNNKLLELIRNHIIPSVELEVVSIVSSLRSVTMASQVLTFNISSNGQMLVNGEVILEADVEAKNGRLYSVDGVLIPPSIEPVLPHRCDISESKIVAGPCVSCLKVTRTSCASGEATGTFMRGCIYMSSVIGVKIPTIGCAQNCNQTVTRPLCCSGFYGPECSPCPGGFSQPCSARGQCADGINGNGTCVCQENFKGSRCQYCTDPSRYGPNCDKSCPCVHGQCDNRPDSDGSCKQDTCQPGYTGRFCERQAQPCGPRVDYCHAHAACDFNGGAVRCVCKPGYRGDGITCVEVDPCTQPERGGCSVNAKCVKTGPGAHVCECLAGWRADGDGCQEINHCLEPRRGGCHQNANCIHIGPGQSDCECKKGFRGNGKECVAVNPCVEQSGQCHYMATCQYLSPGSWKCVCQEGYAGDGTVCYGNVATELSTVPDGSEFNKWVNDAGLHQMLSEGPNVTLLVPSTRAVEKMAKEDKDFWLTQKNLPSIVKFHIMQGINQLIDLRNTSSGLLPTALGKTSLRVSNINETVIINGGMIISPNIAATNGMIHLIDKVLIPDQKMSEGLPDLLTQLSQMPEHSVFRSYLIQYNLTEEIEAAAAYTVFAPSNGAITAFLKENGSATLEENTIRYHVVLSEKLLEQDLRKGKHQETMLGFSYQVGFFMRNNQLFVNDARLNVTDVETYQGVIHGVEKVLKIQQNHCGKKLKDIVQGECGSSCAKENLCPKGTSPMESGATAFTATTSWADASSALAAGQRAPTRQCCLVQSDGTSHCKCAAGFRGNGTFCSAVDACEINNGGCSSNAICRRTTPGKRLCTCNTGYSGDGVVCLEINPCLEDNGGCQENAECTHTGPNQVSVGEMRPWHPSIVTVSLPFALPVCPLFPPSSQQNSQSFWSPVSLLSNCTSAQFIQDSVTHLSAQSSFCNTPAKIKTFFLNCEIKYVNLNKGHVCGGITVSFMLPGALACFSSWIQPLRKRGVTFPSCLPTGRMVLMLQQKNGGCSDYATCTHIAPGERNCTCKRGYMGDGLKCKGTLNKVHEPVADMLERIKDLDQDGPFTVFAPNSDAFRKEGNLAKWSSKGLLSQILRYHLVSCHALQPGELTAVQNVTTLQGETITITSSANTIYLNNKVKVVSSDTMSINGIIHEIDTILVPKNLQVIPKTYFGIIPENLTSVAEQQGYTTFSKLLEDTDVLSLVADPIHQPVTLFWPTDRTMAALPQEQKDFLYSSDNRDKLLEYLKYHIIRDGQILASDLPHSSALVTLQGSELQVRCGGAGRIGDLFLNDGKCRIVQRQLMFNGGIAHGIDCLLSPPSFGGRCDTMDTIDILVHPSLLSMRHTDRERSWGSEHSSSNLYGTPGAAGVKGLAQGPNRCRSLFPATGCEILGSLEEAEEDSLSVFLLLVQRAVKKCDIMTSFTFLDPGCQHTCSVVLWRPKCCPNYFGRDCLACPGGAGGPCSLHGKCDDGRSGSGNCTCEPGFTGTACELCLPGHYGAGCQVCNCTEHGQCDEGVTGSGACFCAEGWTGTTCETHLAVEPVCSPPCPQNAVCKEGNICECKPFYEGDGRTCTVVNLCQQQNGGCAQISKCTQKGVEVTCTCPKGHSGDGYDCVPVDPCVEDDNGGCHEHAVCTMTGPGKRRCECKSSYIGDGLDCEAKELPINRCTQSNGWCHPDALCADLHFEDKTVGVFHLRSPRGPYKLNYTESQESCRKQEAAVATYTQLSYAQQAGFHICAAGWLAGKRVAYPTVYSNPKCGFGHVGIVDYGIRVNLSETWDTFCYRIKDVKCTCKPGYIGDGSSCSGNLLQVLQSKPTFSNFLSQILNYSSNSHHGKDFLNHLSNLTVHSTLFVPDNSALLDNETLSGRDIENHLSPGRTLNFQDLTNGSRVLTRLGHSLLISGFADLSNASVRTASRYVDGRFIVDWNIQASNGIIHVIESPLRAPPQEPMVLQAGHKAGIAMGLLLLVLLIAGAVFVGYHFYSHRARPFQFHYFKSDEGDDAAPVESNPSICNPMYEASHPPQSCGFAGLTDSDKHQVVNSGPYDLFQDS
ncbi:STAB2 protein, partial [Atractosteus spatula]|nr:STAB2 protein [Atractosteus spatula]